MVEVVNAISSAQSAVLRSGAQSLPAPEPAPPPPLSSINFITSEIRVDNLQNVAILEYRSSQTGEVVRQYPDQSQIDAFKAAERLAQLAEKAHVREVAMHAAAASQSRAAQTDNVATVSAQAPAPAASIGGREGASALLSAAGIPSQGHTTGGTVSVVA